MIKYLFFQNDTTDGTGHALSLHFESLLQSKGVRYAINLAVTEDTGREVMQAIADEIAFGSEPFITIADEHNSEFIHADITSIGGTLDGSFQ